MLVFLCAAVEVVDIHFSLGDVSKTTNNHGVVKGADPHRVSEPLGKLEHGLAIAVVHSSGGRLLTREHNELRAVGSPGNILYLVVEDRDESPVLSLVDPDELEGVLAIVAFAGRVVEILCPDKYSFSGW